MKPLRASAPGKAMLSGEYAVLFGAPAVCAAVERVRAPRRATAWLGRADQPTPLARAVARAAFARAGRPVRAGAVRALAGALLADTSALRLEAGGPKLGLGSSSAAAAAMAAVALAALGQRAGVTARLDVALRAHAAASGGRGSGADVAAATLGGIVRVRRSGDRLSARRIALPPGLDVRFYFTGESASTRDLLAALGRARSPGVQEALAALARAAARFSRACSRGDVALLLSAVREHVRALGELERAAAGVAILTPPHRRLVLLAERRGGAAKPSGAGGGDVAVVFAPGRRTGAAIGRDARREGLVAVPLRLGAAGVALVRGAASGRDDAPRRRPPR